MKLELVAKTRRLHCWIESFTDATAGLPTPELFRKWAAIGAIAGALERRVWTESSLERVFANLFILLVSPPGVGKTMAISQVERLWLASKKLKVAPDDVTKASLLDHLAKSLTTQIYPPNEMLQYHSLNVAADEFGVFCAQHDLGFMSVMNKLYDNKDQYKESRRGRETDLIMVNPQVNMIAGTQPDFLASFLPPEAWGMGFMSRIVMVYQGKPIKQKLFGKKTKVETKDLLEDLKQVCDLHGEMDWTDAATAEMTRWYEAGLEPVPEHTKLKHYVARRILTTLKLCIISAVSRSNSMMIEVEDVERARDWLLEVEALIPDVFKDMSGNNDAMVIRDLHQYVWQQFAKTGKPVHRSRIDAFLAVRTPPYNAENIVKLCIRAKILLSVGPDLFQPGHKNVLDQESDEDG